MVIGVLAGVEVCRGFALVGTEAAAVVVVRAREEPPVTAFAQKRIPHAANLGRVNARTTVGAATDCTSRIATPVGFGSVTGHRFKTECDLGAGIVEVTQVLDVEAVAASRVVDAGALEVGRNEVGRRGSLFVHPLDAFDRLDVTEVGIGCRVGSGEVADRSDLGRRGIDQRVVRAARDRAIPEVLSATAGVAIAAIETVFVLGLQVGVTGRRGRRPGRLALQKCGRGVLVARGVLLQSDPNRLLRITAKGLDDLVLKFLNFLPTPHGFRGRCTVALDIGAAVGQRGFPGLVRSFECRGGLAAAAVGHGGGGLPGAIRAIGQTQRRCDGLKWVFGQRAVTGAATTVVGLDEPVELECIDRFVDQLFDRKCAVRAGCMVVEVTGNVRASGFGGGFVGGRGAWGDGDNGRDGGDRNSDFAHFELGLHVDEIL